MNEDFQVSELRESLVKITARNALLDVREYAEFSGGRVPGAILFPLASIEQRSGELARDQKLYVICRTGRRGLEAKKKLIALGFADIENVAGGLEAWKKQGYPIEKDARPVWSLERQVRLTAGSIVLIGVLLSVLVWQPLIWLSAFVGAGLTFSAVTDTCGMALMLAQLPWNKPVPPSSDAKVQIFNNQKT